MVIDGKDLILGRLASIVAKKALLGEKIDIVNSQDIVITGKKDHIRAKYKRVSSMGVPAKGPHLPRLSDRFVRRAIKRMLPFKAPRGRDAYKQIMCYIGVPEQFKDAKLETIKEINIEKVPNYNYMKVGEICKFLGGKA